jgi:hypothetical protein
MASKIAGQRRRKEGGEHQTHHSSWWFYLTTTIILDATHQYHSAQALKQQNVGGIIIHDMLDVLVIIS